MNSDDTADTETRPLLLGSTDSSALPTVYKVVRIIVLFWLWICFGAFAEITGPVLPELIIQTHSQYEIMAQSIAMRGVGHAIGGIIGGLTIDRWIQYVDILTAVGIIIYTGFGLGSAYAQNVALLFFLILMQGSIETWLHIAGFRIALKTWKDQSATALHALHMGYGIGSAVVPQLVTPFLDPRFSGGVIPTDYNSTCRHNDTVPVNTSTSNPIVPKYPANFVVAYWVLAGLSSVLAFIFAAYHVHGRVTGVRIDSYREEMNVEKSSFKESLSPRNCSPAKPTHAALIIAALFFYHITCVPMAEGFTKFIFAYARDGPCLTVSESTGLETAYFAALTLGRLCVSVTSTKVHMKYILQVVIIGVLVSTLFLFFMQDNITILWVFCSALGFFTGPVLSSPLAWANRYIEVTATAQIVPEMGAAIGDVAFLYGVGYGYQHFGPYVLWPSQLVLASVLCVVAWTMQIFGSLHGDRYKQNYNRFE